MGTIARDVEACNLRVSLESALMRAERPAFILFSLRPPGMSGLELLGEPKRAPGLRPIPARVFTNSVSPYDIEQSYRLGAQSYLLKPFGLTELGEMVHCILVYWLQVVTLTPPCLPPLQ